MPFKKKISVLRFHSRGVHGARPVIHLFTEGLAWRSYVQSSSMDFIGHFPVKLTQGDIRNYHLQLNRVKKLVARTINLHLYGIRCFCQFMLPDTDIMRPFTRIRPAGLS